MKKVLGIVSWIIAVIGAITIVLAEWFIDNYILFWCGIPVFIIGVVGILVFGEKSRRFLGYLFDFF